jgi:hypothetical protein
LTSGPVDRGGPFEDELMRLLAAQSVQWRGTERDFPSYQQVKQAVLRQRREAAQVYDRRESEIVRLVPAAKAAAAENEEEIARLFLAEPAVPFEPIPAEEPEPGRPGSPPAADRY